MANKKCLNWGYIFVLIENNFIVLLVKLWIKIYFRCADWKATVPVNDHRAEEFSGIKYFLGKSSKSPRMIFEEQVSGGDSFTKNMA